MTTKDDVAPWMGSRKRKKGISGETGEIWIKFVIELIATSRREFLNVKNDAVDMGDAAVVGRWVEGTRQWHYP